MSSSDVENAVQSVVENALQTEVENDAEGAVEEVVEKQEISSRIKPRKEHLVEEGDLVVLYKSFFEMSFAYVKRGCIYDSRFGHFTHETMIGIPYGGRIFSKNLPFYIHVLRPTPELWNKVLPNQTQIVQEADQNLIVSRLNLLPGDIVVESGTGSGAMSTAIHRSISPNGHLHTFEFNEVRAGLATEQFKKNKMDGVITVQHRDVCGKNGEGGFGEELNGKVDAVFLDLPEPWLAISHAFSVLKANKRLCSYSPCLEQVHKTCQELRKFGFRSISTVEMRERAYSLVEAELEGPKWGGAQKEAGGEGEGSPADSKKRKRSEGESGGRDGARKITSVKASSNMRGHTGFLTFAVKNVQTG